MIPGHSPDIPISFKIILLGDSGNISCYQRCWKDYFYQAIY